MDNNGQAAVALVLPSTSRALIEAGRRDARRWLDRHAHFWCHDPAHDFDVDPLQAERLREDHAIDEWRSLRHQ